MMADRFEFVCIEIGRMIHMLRLGFDLLHTDTESGDSSFVDSEPQNAQLPEPALNRVYISRSPIVSRFIHAGLGSE